MILDLVWAMVIIDINDPPLLPHTFIASPPAKTVWDLGHESSATGLGWSVS